MTKPMIEQSFAVAEFLLTDEERRQLTADLIRIQKRRMGIPLRPKPDASYD